MDASVGGGFALVGVIVGLTSSWLVERWRAQREDRHRFTADKKQLYAAFLAGVRGHLQLVHQQRKAVADAHERGVVPSDVPNLPDTEELGRIAQEIVLLAPHLRPAVESVYPWAIAVVDVYAYDAAKAAPWYLHAGTSIELYEGVMKEALAFVDTFLAAAQDDLGVAAR